MKTGDKWSDSKYNLSAQKPKVFSNVRVNGMKNNFKVLAHVPGRMALSFIEIGGIFEAHNYRLGQP